MQRGHGVAEAVERRGLIARRQQVRVLLVDADRERGRLGRRGGRGDRARGRLSPAATGEEDEGGEAAEAPQTALTSCSSATRNEEPQPQAATTLGLTTWKPAPWREST